MKILVMLDAPHKYDEIKSILGENTEIVEAYSSPHLIRLLEKDPEIDIIICCAKSLIDSKPDPLAFIRQYQRYYWIPVLAGCDDTDTEILMELLRRGVHDMIFYPFDAQTLKARIEYAHQTGRRRIVVIDDEQGIRDILVEVMELERHIAYSFADAESALSFLEMNNDIHAVVSDIMLPGISGLELMEKVKSRYEYIPVILITGYSGKLSPEEALSCGADGYFKKPFHNIELVRTLQAILQKYGSYRKARFPHKIENLKKSLNTV